MGKNDAVVSFDLGHFIMLCDLVFQCVQVYWRVVDPLSPRTAQPVDLSSVLMSVDGRVVCPANSRLCTFHLVFVDNKVVSPTACCM